MPGYIARDGVATPGAAHRAVVPAGSRLPLDAADAYYLPRWLQLDEANALFESLRASIRWERHRLRLFGRALDAPRLSCWIGDAGTEYRYSGTRFVPHAWPAVLQRLRGRLETACAARFNSVLANLYRDGADSMGWHSDDEAELGTEPVIASVSLGAVRRFRLQHRQQRASGCSLELAPGSLLLMRGATQRNYRHCVPRTARTCGERINLTFRWVEARSSQPPFPRTTP